MTTIIRHFIHLYFLAEFEVLFYIYYIMPYEKTLIYNIFKIYTHNSDPKIIWERNFTSAGTAINFLTPIGSINLAYGIPWHEPKSEKCKKDSAFCFPSSDQKAPLWKRGEFHFNVGAKF